MRFTVYCKICRVTYIAEAVIKMPMTPSILVPDPYKIFAIEIQNQGMKGSFI